MSIKAFANNILGIFLIPLSVLSLVACIRILMRVPWEIYPSYLFPLGGATYVLWYVVEVRCIRFYVFAHELMHAIASFFFGGKLLAFFVGKRSGFVRLTKSNLIVSIVPYCIPFYACVTFLIYFFASIMYETKQYAGLFSAVTGFFIMHHLLLSWDYLKKGQKDASKYGSLFSWNIILIMNLFFIMSALTILFQTNYTELFAHDIAWLFQMAIAEVKK